MKEINIRSYAKINLSLDVGSLREDGYHPVDMVMQQIQFHDNVLIRLKEGEPEIKVTTNRPYLPTDQRNLAYRAAALMMERYAVEGAVEIDIRKRIPVAAGLAGGSGNGAAVIHGLNALADLGLNLEQICTLCAELGSDMPFSAVGQAAANDCLPKVIREDPMAANCVRATGRGTVMKKLPGLNFYVVIAKPDHSVSTGEVYMGIDSCNIQERPDNDRMEETLKAGRVPEKDFVNVLEAYTLDHYPKVAELKSIMKAQDPDTVLMSGSGPTVFSLFKERSRAIDSRNALRDMGYEAYWSRTLT